MTSLNNRCQSNNNDLRPNSFCKARSKILVGNFEPIMDICGKMFVINLHNRQMLFMLWIKNKFSECLGPLHKYEGSQWKTFWPRFCPSPQTRWGIRRQYPQNLFCAPPNLFQIFFVPPKFVLNIWWKQKSFPPKNVFCPQNLETWLRAWFCQNCVCN